MDLELRGKVAIVTGASRGIGHAIARQLSNEGMRLVLAARSRDLLDQVARECGTECLVHAGDLREPDVPAAMVKAALERYGQIDLLVNNAGATKRGDFLALEDGDWSDGFALKLFGAMRCARAAWPLASMTVFCRSPPACSFSCGAIAPACEDAPGVWLRLASAFSL